MSGQDTPAVHFAFLEEQMDIEMPDDFHYEQLEFPFGGGPASNMEDAFDVLLAAATDESMPTPGELPATKELSFPESFLERPCGLSKPLFMSDAERLLVATEGEFQEAMLCVVGYKASEMSVMMHQPLDKPVRDMAWLGSESRLVLAQENVLRVYETERRFGMWAHPLVTVEEAEAPLREVAVWGEHLLSGGHDQRVKAWSLGQGRAALLASLEREHAVSSVRWRPGAGAGATGPPVFSWTTDGGELAMHDLRGQLAPVLLQASSQEALYMHFYHDENVVLTGGEKGTLHVVDLRKAGEGAPTLLSLEDPGLSHVGGATRAPSSSSPYLPYVIFGMGGASLWDISVSPHSIWHDRRASLEAGHYAEVAAAFDAHGNLALCTSEGRLVVHPPEICRIERQKFDV